MPLMAVAWWEMVTALVAQSGATSSGFSLTCVPIPANAASCHQTLLSASKSTCSRSEGSYLVGKCCKQQNSCTVAWRVCSMVSRRDLQPCHELCIRLHHSCLQGPSNVCKQHPSTLKSAQKGADRADNLSFLPLPCCCREPAND